jgi:hypothetical protein
VSNHSGFLTHYGINLLLNQPTNQPTNQSPTEKQNSITIQKYICIRNSHACIDLIIIFVQEAPLTEVFFRQYIYLCIC